MTHEPFLAYPNVNGQIELTINQTKSKKYGAFVLFSPEFDTPKEVAEWCQQEAIRRANEPLA